MHLTARPVLGALTATAAYTGATILLSTAGQALRLELGSTASAVVDPVVGLGAALAAWLVLTWLLVIVWLSLAAGAGPTASPWARAVTRCSPAVLRRLAALVLGVGLAGASAPGMPAAALPRPPALCAAAPADSLGLPGDVTRVDRPAEIPSSGPVDRPARGSLRRSDPFLLRSGAAGHGRADRHRRTVGAEVVVRRGDTLWGIAARHLGPAADLAAVASEWPRWHLANRAVIGPDPHVLLPGQRLRPPRA